jgi:hypothetical protein
VKQHLVQILVVVATIQVKPLKTEVEKGSVWTAIEYGLVAPKPEASALKRLSSRTLTFGERESG